MYERGDVSGDVMSWPSCIRVTVAKRSSDLGSCVTLEGALTGLRTGCKAGSVLRCTQKFLAYSRIGFLEFLGALL